MPEVPGWRTVGSALDEIVLPAGRQVFPIRRFDGTVSEVVLLADLVAVPADDRDLKRAQDLARPAVALRVHDSVDRLVPAAAAVSTGPASYGVVLAEAGPGGPNGPDGLAEGGDSPQVLGVIGPEEITRAMALAASLPSSDGGGTWPGSRVR